MVLQGERCVVRRWRAGDAASLTLHANNVNVARHLRDRFPHPYTRAHARDFLGSLGRSDENLAIDVAGEAVGGIGFVGGVDVERFSAEIGYWLGEPYWGRGIATEAVALMTAHLFAARGLLRVFAVPFAGNPASARVLEKAGFVREGVMRAGAVKAGVPQDLLLYARLNPDWRLPE